MIIKNLPWPPSVNHYWLRNRNGSVRISDAGKKYRADMEFLCNDYNKMSGRVLVAIQASPPDKRKRDLDNVLKALLDAIVHAGLIDDDSCIDNLQIERCDVEKGGCIGIRIQSLE